MDENEKLLKEHMKAIEAISSTLEPILKQLETIRDTVKKVNDQLGFTARAEEIRNQIKTYGWDLVQQVYHPDYNLNDPAAQQMFDLVKYIYSDMKGKGDI